MASAGPAEVTKEAGAAGPVGAQPPGDGTCTARPRPAARLIIHNPVDLSFFIHKLRSPQALLDPRVAAHSSPNASASSVYQPVRGRRGRMEGSPDAGEAPTADVDEYYYGPA